MAIVSFFFIATQINYNLLVEKGRQANFDYRALMLKGHKYELCNMHGCMATTNYIIDNNGF